ncbi:MAG TPA: hypothetical protein VLR94_10975, partial [Acidobacteriota bacterium]|nr:hypothetical protein [Acidobacteriota bacterium]
MKGLFISVIFLVCLALSASAETLYLTFVPKNPAESIEQKDISLKIDKTDMPVADFFKVDTAQRTPLILLHPAGRRHYIFLYDLVNSKPEEILAARKKTVEILQKVGKEDLVAFAGISRKSRLVFYGNFTADNDKWLWSLNMIGRETPAGLLQGPDGNFYSAQFSATHTPVEMLSDEVFLKNVQAFAPDDKKKQESRSAYVQGLVELAYALSTVKGRKDIILFSPGFDTKDITLNLDQVQAPAAEAAPDVPEHQEFEDVVSGQSGAGQEEEAPVRRPRQSGRGVNFITDLLEAADAHVFAYCSAENEFYKDLFEKTGGLYFNPAAGVSGDADQIVAS